MTDDVDHGRTHAGLVVLGLLLAPTGLGVLLGVLGDVLPDLARTPATVLAAVAVILMAVVLTIVAGIHLLVVGTGGGGGRLDPARRAMRAALMANGAAALVALVALVLGRSGPSRPFVVVAFLVLASLAGASFLLARRVTRYGARPGLPDRPVAALAIAALPLLVMLAALTLVLAAG